jgi:hypothetical protein
MDENRELLDTIKTYNMSDSISMIESACVDLRNLEEGNNETLLRIMSASTGQPIELLKKARKTGIIEVIVTSTERIMQLEE